MANFAEMSVALQMSRHRLENDLIKLRRLCSNVGLSDMGTQLAAEGFERDIFMVDEAAAILKVMSRYEGKILDLIQREEMGEKSWVRKFIETAQFAMF